MAFLPRDWPLYPECRGQGAITGHPGGALPQEATPAPSTATAPLNFCVLSFFPLLNSFSSNKDSDTVELSPDCWTGIFPREALGEELEMIPS